jgi:hypothetical protein
MSRAVDAAIVAPTRQRPNASGVERLRVPSWQRPLLSSPQQVYRDFSVFPMPCGVTIGMCLSRPGARLPSMSAR